jgi:hypothetical protein
MLADRSSFKFSLYFARVLLGLNSYHLSTQYANNPSLVSEEPDWQLIEFGQTLDINAVGNSH